MSQEAADALEFADASSALCQRAQRIADAPSLPPAAIAGPFPPVGGFESADAALRTVFDADVPPRLCLGCTDAQRASFYAIRATLYDHVRSLLSVRVAWLTTTDAPLATAADAANLPLHLGVEAGWNARRCDQAAARALASHCAALRQTSAAEVDRIVGIAVRERSRLGNCGLEGPATDADYVSPAESNQGVWRADFDRQLTVSVPPEGPYVVYANPSVEEDSILFVDERVTLRRDVAARLRALGLPIASDRASDAVEAAALTRRWGPGGRCRANRSGDALEAAIRGRSSAHVQAQCGATRQTILDCEFSDTAPSHCASTCTFSIAWDEPLQGFHQWFIPFDSFTDLVPWTSAAANLSADSVERVRRQYGGYYGFGRQTEGVGSAIVPLRLRTSIGELDNADLAATLDGSYDALRACGAQAPLHVRALAEIGADRRATRVEVAVSSSESTEAAAHACVTHALQTTTFLAPIPAPGRAWFSFDVYGQWSRANPSASTAFPGARIGDARIRRVGIGWNDRALERSWPDRLEPLVAACVDHLDEVAPNTPVRIEARVSARGTLSAPRVTSSSSQLAACVQSRLRDVRLGCPFVPDTRVELALCVSTAE